MSRIILGTKDSSLHELFSGRPDYQLTDFDQSFLNDLRPSSKDFLFVLDLEVFEALTPDDRIKMEGYSVLVLLPVDYEIDSLKNLRTYSTKTFFYKTGCPGASVNLLAFTELFLEKIVVDHRLTAYIKDSFRDIVDSNLLQKQKKEIEELNEKLKEISRVDYLTNLLNRRALLEAFESEKRRALRSRWRMRSISTVTHDGNAELDVNNFAHEAQGGLDDHIGNFACLMIDIDHFKVVNDTYGHLMGDKVLKLFGELLHQKGLFRDSDVLGRYGGEEFIVLLPETNSTNALIPAERLREAMKKIVFEDNKKNTFSVTISVGISEFLPEEVSCEEMIKRADDALYYAKEHGRDQVCIYEKLPSI